MKTRGIVGNAVVAALLAGAVAGCGSSSGGIEGATDEQKRDPAWARARLNEMTRDASIPKATARKSARR